MIEVLKGGILATIQDGGRPGLRNQGVPVSGAMDSLALQAANLLLQKPPLAPAIEITFGQTQLRFQKSGWVALTGADLGASFDNEPVTPGWRFHVEPGQVLHFRQPKKGFRAYLAVSGELEVPQVLGSASTDISSGFNAPLATGDELGWRPEGDFQAPLFVRVPGTGRLRVLPGPEYESFDQEAKTLFWHNDWTIGSLSNRMGYRLNGPKLTRLVGDELPSHGVIPGTIQVPGNGQPIVLAMDAQATGGYPKLGVIIAADLWQLGQLGPGRRLGFIPVTMAEARLAWQQQQAYLKHLEEFVAAH
ncbi:biotin-dependent carboxyltransferase family protein [Gallaecimonas kandeliae]|uniref:5-oxoprolinase subunit C family protein n=1 Tax=Gallaecimonas kandeliae TaxID=3029055 RepID=UPI0026479CBE|nr:biotin-dependent carboxyltransferase family protein [Gallaecimonas kandeliae]WKE64274.1 biotin-dependent carboxyltransferase family protein [Gallaecimonas kandeliae]